MPWCPQCKSEYRDGITVCADCKITLVAEEPELFAEAPLVAEEPELFAEAHQVTEEPELFAEAPLKPAGIYQDNTERAQENRSAAWTLLLVGGVGLAVLVLGMMDLLPFKFKGTNNYMIYGVMSALFLLFVVMGAVSMRNSKIFARKAESENSLRDTMVKWSEENLHSGDLDKELMVTDEAEEEILYFKRFEIMKKKLNHQFVNLDEAFLEHFIDEIYDSIFSKKEEGDSRA